MSSYVWDFGDGTQPLKVVGFNVAKKQTHIYKQIGFFKVNVTATNSKGSAKATTNVWVQGSLVCLIALASSIFL